MPRIEGIIALLIQILTVIPSIWLAFVVIWGLSRRKKTYPNADRQARFAVVICARNEEAVIDKLLTSLSQQKYPQDKLRIFVLADHCTDHTAQIASGFDRVIVMERNEGPTRGKGDVLAWGIRRIMKEYGDDIDSFAFFDADNIVREDYLIHINDMLQSGEEIVQGNRLGGGPYKTFVTKWFAIYWMLYSFLFSYPRQKMGLSAFLTGTGFAVKKEVLSAGWRTSSITEDVEFSVQQCLAGRRVAFCLDAVCFDEQPSEIRVLFRQLIRWCTGSYQILRRYIGAWMHALKISSEDPYRRRTTDNLMLLLLGPVNFVAFFANLVMIPLTLWYFPGLALLGLALILAGTEVVLFCMIRFFYHQELRPFMPALLFMPVFFFFYSICSVIALVHPVRSWKRIDHEGIAAPQESKALPPAGSRKAIASREDKEEVPYKMTELLVREGENDRLNRAAGAEGVEGRTMSGVKNPHGIEACKMQEERQV